LAAMFTLGRQAAREAATSCAAVVGLAQEVQ
jgi:hypothetical protein